MIFLAISGLLLTMAIIGSDGMARRARFTDSVNTLHSTFQKYYEQTASGVNTRGTVGVAVRPVPVQMAACCWAVSLAFGSTVSRLRLCGYAM